MLEIQKTMEHVHSIMSGEATGHDWWHVNRVWNLACTIHEEEGGDFLVIQLAALLHDIADWKFDENQSVDTSFHVAYRWVYNLGLSPECAQHVAEIVRDLSFKGAGVKTEMHTVEGRVVQDADRLDALGAIGIARAFAYGGFKGSEMYDPACKPQSHTSFEEYKKSNGTTINHFYEKLLLLKDRMNTQTGKKLAEERHQFMQKYLNQFFKEWGK